MPKVVNPQILDARKLTHSSEWLSKIPGVRFSEIALVFDVWLCRKKYSLRTTSLSLETLSESDVVEMVILDSRTRGNAARLPTARRLESCRKDLRAWFRDCGTGIAAGGTLAKRAGAELTRINKPVDPAYLDQTVTEGAIVLHPADTFITTVAGRGKSLDVNIAAISETRKGNHHDP